MIFARGVFRTCAGAGSTCYIDGSMLRDDDRRSTTRECFRGGPWTAPRPEGRFTSGRGVPIELSPTAGRAPTAGPEAARPCAGPPEARARRGAKAGSARAGRRRIETVRRATTIDGPPTGHMVRPRSPRPRAKAIRRAAPSHTARRDGGAVDSVVARPPGRSRPFARKASRAGSTLWDAGRHYEEGDDVRA